MAERERKKGRTRTQKLEYFENEKSFLVEVKKIFIVFKGLSFGEKKSLIKIVDTSF